MQEFYNKQNINKHIEWWDNKCVCLRESIKLLTIKLNNTDISLDEYIEILNKQQGLSINGEIIGKGYLLNKLNEIDKHYKENKHIYTDEVTFGIKQDIKFAENMLDIAETRLCELQTLRLKYLLV